MKLRTSENILFINILIICTAMILSSFTDSLRRTYQYQVANALRLMKAEKTEVLEEQDIQHLPALVQKYIRFTGVVGKPRVRNVCIKASGQMCSRPGDQWVPFQSEQYNFIEDPRRFFYMRARKMGIPATGLHFYQDGSASMVIKVAGLFKVVDARGPEMNQSETVTLFNDMCFMAPASLTDKNIRWFPLDETHVRARFTNSGITIEAILTIDLDGRLLNFISYDRYETSDGKTYIKNPWETPVTGYGEFNGMRLPSKADVIYKRPSGDFCYLKFNLLEIEYNRK